MLVTYTTTYKYRVYPKHAKELKRMANVVNVVWNYCNETQLFALKHRKKWPTGYDLMKLTSGTSKEFNVTSKTIEAVCEQYEKSRKQFKKAKLKWRGKKSLGWVPCKVTLKVKQNEFYYMKQRFDVFKDRQIPDDAKVLVSSFNEDSRGRWYLNVTIRVEKKTETPIKECGIDLGLKDMATLSDGYKVSAIKIYRDLQQKLAIAQRARNKKIVRAIHSKIKNQRKDFLHKESSKIAKVYGFIAVGDVSSSKLAKTKMAKSVLDSGWFMFKEMLRYKSIRNGGVFLEVSERNTTRTCSSCGVIPDSSPKGMDMLGIREWVCSACNTTHDRDVNAAKLILAAGHRRLAEEKGKSLKNEQLLC